MTTTTSAPRLGDKAREIVTGREGTLTGVSEFLWGCRQYLLHYTDTDGKPQSEWYDVGRLEVLERDVLEPVEHQPEAPAERRGFFGLGRQRPAFAGAETPPPAR